MIVDASAVLAILRDEPDAAFFAGALAEFTQTLSSADRSRASDISYL
jgi:uncharacterized protein with PIN domain